MASMIRTVRGKYGGEQNAEIGISNRVTDGQGKRSPTRYRGSGVRECRGRSERMTRGGEAAKGSQI